jgi:hypothetical protein
MSVLLYGGCLLAATLFLVDVVFYSKQRTDRIIVK